MMRIPADVCGAVIGRNGETLKEIQKESGAKVNIDKSTNPDDPHWRSALINGPQECVEYAKKMIQDVIDEKLKADKEKKEKGEGKGAVHNRWQSVQANAAGKKDRKDGAKNPKAPAQTPAGGAATSSAPPAKEKLVQEKRYIDEVNLSFRSEIWHQFEDGDPNDKELFVCGLPKGAVEEDIWSLLQNVGAADLSEILLLKGPGGESKGMAYILFNSHAVAVKARRELDGSAASAVPQKKAKGNGEDNDADPDAKLQVWFSESERCAKGPAGVYKSDTLRLLFGDAGESAKLIKDNVPDLRSLVLSNGYVSFGGPPSHDFRVHMVACYKAGEGAEVMPKVMAEWEVLIETMHLQLAEKLAERQAKDPNSMADGPAYPPGDNRRKDAATGKRKDAKGGDADMLRLLHEEDEDAEQKDEMDDGVDMDEENGKSGAGREVVVTLRNKSTGEEVHESTICGRYCEHGQNSSRPVFRRAPVAAATKEEGAPEKEGDAPEKEEGAAEKEKGDAEIEDVAEAYIFYGTSNAGLEGWFFATEVEGDEILAENLVDDQEPPASGWDIWALENPDLELVIQIVASTAPARKKHRVRKRRRTDKDGEEEATGPDATTDGDGQQAPPEAGSSATGAGAEGAASAPEAASRDRRRRRRPKEEEAGADGRDSRRRKSNQEGPAKAGAGSKPPAMPPAWHAPPPGYGPPPGMAGWGWPQHPPPSAGGPPPGSWGAPPPPPPPGHGYPPPAAFPYYNGNRPPPPVDSRLPPPPSSAQSRMQPPPVPSARGGNVPGPPPPGAPPPAPTSSMPPPPGPTSSLPPPPGPARSGPPPPAPTSAGAPPPGPPPPGPTSVAPPPINRPTSGPPPPGPPPPGPPRPSPSASGPRASGLSPSGPPSSWPPPGASLPSEPLQGRSISFSQARLGDNGVRAWCGADPDRYKDGGVALLRRVGEGFLESVDFSRNELTERGVAEMVGLLMAYRRPVKKLKLHSNKISSLEPLCRYLEDPVCGFGASTGGGQREVHLSHNQVSAGALEQLLGRLAIAKSHAQAARVKTTPIFMRVEHNECDRHVKDIIRRIVGLNIHLLQKPNERNSCPPDTDILLFAGEV